MIKAVENPFLPAASSLAHCVDMMMRTMSAQMDTMARIIADAAGVYHVLILGSGATALLPLAYLAKSQARVVVDGLNTLARHGRHVRVDVDPYSGLPRVHLSGLPRHSVITQKEWSCILQAFAMIGGCVVTS